MHSSSVPASQASFLPNCHPQVLSPPPQLSAAPVPVQHEIDSKRKRTQAEILATAVRTSARYILDNFCVRPALEGPAFASESAPECPFDLEVIPPLDRFIGSLLQMLRQPSLQGPAASGTLCLLDRLRGRFPGGRTRTPHGLYLGAFLLTLRTLRHGDKLAEAAMQHGGGLFTPAAASLMERDIQVLLGECSGQLTAEDLRDVWAVILVGEIMEMPSFRGDHASSPAGYAAVPKESAILCEKEILEAAADV